VGMRVKPFYLSFLEVGNIRELAMKCVEFAGLF